MTYFSPSVWRRLDSWTVLVLYQIVLPPTTPVIKQHMIILDSIYAREIGDQDTSAVLVSPAPLYPK